MTLFGQWKLTWEELAWTNYIHYAVGKSSERTFHTTSAIAVELWRNCGWTGFLYRVSWSRFCSLYLLFCNFAVFETVIVQYIVPNSCSMHFSHAVTVRTFASRVQFFAYLLRSSDVILTSSVYICNRICQVAPLCTFVFYNSCAQIIHHIRPVAPRLHILHVSKNCVLLMRKVRTVTAWVKCTLQEFGTPYWTITATTTANDCWITRPSCQPRDWSIDNDLESHNLSVSLSLAIGTASKKTRVNVRVRVKSGLISGSVQL